MRTGSAEVDVNEANEFGILPRALRLKVRSDVHADVTRPRRRTSAGSECYKKEIVKLNPMTSPARDERGMFSLPFWIE